VGAALVAGRTENGVFGAKLMWGTLDLVVHHLGTVYPDLADEDVRLLNQAFGRTRFVYLRRDDVLAQAVSWLRAEQTSTWYIGGKGEIGGNGGSAGAPTFDAGRIDQLIQLIDEHNKAWEAWFASFDIQPRMVLYEELDADMVGVTRSLLDFLGLDLPLRHTIVPHHKRQADELNDQWIDQYKRYRRSRVS
jgi:LPS sulfotransferase NodH